MTVSRRGLLGGAVALAGATTMVGGAVVTASPASAASASSVLVVLSLRGASDGLSLVVPHGDPVYYAARPTDRHPQGVAARRRHGRLLRAAPGTVRPAAALDRRQAGGGPRHRAAGGQPLALRRHGGDGGRRPGLERARGVAQPAGRRHPRHVSAAGVQRRHQHHPHLAGRARLHDVRRPGRRRRAPRQRRARPPPEVAEHHVAPREVGAGPEHADHVRGHQGLRPGPGRGGQQRQLPGHGRRPGPGHCRPDHPRGRRCRGDHRRPGRLGHAHRHGRRGRRLDGEQRQGPRPGDRGVLRSTSAPRGPRSPW